MQEFWATIPTKKPSYMYNFQLGWYPKRTNHPMLGIKTWFCDINVNNICVAGKMLEVSLVVPSQTIFMPRMEC